MKENMVETVILFKEDNKEIQERSERPSKLCAVDFECSG